MTDSKPPAAKAQPPVVRGANAPNLASRGSTTPNYRGMGGGSKKAPVYSNRRVAGSPIQAVEERCPPKPSNHRPHPSAPTLAPQYQGTPPAEDDGPGREEGTPDPREIPAEDDEEPAPGGDEMTRDEYERRIAPIRAQLAQLEAEQAAADGQPVAPHQAAPEPFPERNAPNYVTAPRGAVRGSVRSGASNAPTYVQPLRTTEPNYVKAPHRPMVAPAEGAPAGAPATADRTPQYVDPPIRQAAPPEGANGSSPEAPAPVSSASALRIEITHTPSPSASPSDAPSQPAPVRDGSTTGRVMDMEDYRAAAEAGDTQAAAMLKQLGNEAE